MPVATPDGSRFEVRRDWRDRLFADSGFLAAGLVAATRLLKEGRHRNVSLVTLRDGGQVVVKEVRTRSGIEGFLGRLVGRDPALREWRRGRELEREGLPCARPLAIAISLRGRAGRARGLLVTAALEGDLDLADEAARAALPGRERRRLAAAFGRLFRRLHDAGFSFRDAHADNFVVQREADGSWRVVPLDLRDVRTGGPGAGGGRERALSRVYRGLGWMATRAERLAFLAAYAPETGRVELLRLARRVHRAGEEEARTYRWRRSRSVWGENGRFTRRRAGRLRWNVRRSELDPSLERLLQDPESAFRDPAAVLKAGRSSTVVRSGPWVVKRNNQKRCRNRALDRLRPGRPRRALRLSFLLESAGIRTPRVAAAGERRRLGLVGRGYLVARDVAGGRQIHEALRRAQRKGRGTILERVGLLVARLVRAGLRHRDLKAGNLLVDTEGRPWLVDLDGLSFRPRAARGRARGDLERLLRDLREHAGLTAGEERHLRGLIADSPTRGRAADAPAEG